MNEQAKKQCSRCGSWMDSSAVFCPVCGAQTTNAPQQPQQPQQPWNQGQAQPPVAGKKNNKKLIIGIAVGLVVLLLFVFVLFPAMTGKRRPRPDMTGNTSADSVSNTVEINADAAVSL